MPLLDVIEPTWRCPCCWSNNPTKELAEQCANSHDSLPAEKDLSSKFMNALGQMDRYGTPRREEVIEIQELLSELNDDIVNDRHPRLILESLNLISQQIRLLVETYRENEMIHMKLAADRKGCVYLAGPMSGYAEHNFPAFNAEAAQLRSTGLVVCNPADHGVVKGAEWGDYLRYDLARLVDCERIHLLPGWEKSKGALLEVRTAHALGMQFTYAEGAVPFVPSTRQSMGEAASAWLHENDPEGLDWCDSRNVDGLLDAMFGKDWK